VSRAQNHFLDGEIVVGDGERWVEHTESDQAEGRRRARSERNRKREGGGAEGGREVSGGIGGKERGGIGLKESGGT
jgi:hypothetical protein